MSYVDLNPIRAKMADSLETSDFTSIQQRISQWTDTQKKAKNNQKDVKVGLPNNHVPLVSLISLSQDNHLHALGYLEKDYLELVDWAGRSICPGKRGYIPEYSPPIVNRLGLEPENFLQHMEGKRPHLSLTHAIGRLEKLHEYARQLRVQFIRGYKLGQVIYR